MPALYVGITDADWYRRVSSDPSIDEVNFWQPSAGSGFRVLDEGGLFLFKLKYPEISIVGGARFAGYARLSLADAWNAFGSENRHLPDERRSQGDSASPDTNSVLPAYCGLPKVMTPLIAADVTPAAAHAVGSGGWNASCPSADWPASRVVVSVLVAAGGACVGPV
jgi:hypothetical protein